VQYDTKTTKYTQIMLHPLVLVVVWRIGNTLVLSNVV